MKHLSLETERVFISQASNQGSQVSDRVSEVPGSLVFTLNDRCMLATDCLEHGLEAGESTELSEMEVNLFSGHAAHCANWAPVTRAVRAPGSVRRAGQDVLIG